MDDQVSLEGSHTGSNPVLTTNVIRLTAKNGINEEYLKWLQTLMIYKWVNSIITLNSQVAEWVNAKMIQVAQSIIVKVAPTGSIPVLTTKKIEI